MTNECSECGRPIVAFVIRRVSAGKRKITPTLDHDLCQKCWKAELDRNRPKRVNEG